MMVARALHALSTRRLGLLLSVVAALIVITVLDAYYAFTEQPVAPELARVFSLTSSVSVSVAITVGMTAIACTAAAWLAAASRDSALTAHPWALGLLALALGAFGLLEVVQPDLTTMALLAIEALLWVGLLAGGLTAIRQPPAARWTYIAGLLLLATNPLTDRVERVIAGNPSYYHFDEAAQMYAFDATAWRYLWAVSRAQELTELLALLCFAFALLILVAGSSPQPDATKQHGGRLRASAEPSARQTTG